MSLSLDLLVRLAQAERALVTRAVTAHEAGAEALSAAVPVMERQAAATERLAAALEKLSGGEQDGDAIELHWIVGPATEQQ